MRNSLGKIILIKLQRNFENDRNHAKVETVFIYPNVKQSSYYTMMYPYLIKILLDYMKKYLPKDSKIDIYHTVKK